MRKANWLVGLALVAAASTSADTQQTKVETSGAYVYYSRDDRAVGGKQVSLSVSVGPTWPPGSPLRVDYFAQECTIDSCSEMFPGYEWCYCSYFPTVFARGSGQLPKGAFAVSPQGVARLAVAAAQLTGGPSDGRCERLDLTWTPSGQSHFSEDSKIRSETPTEVYSGVGHEDSWQAPAVGTACGVTLTAADLVQSSSVQKSHWTNVVRTPKP
jgi:hypothetical protein